MTVQLIFRVPQPCDVQKGEEIEPMRFGVGPLRPFHGIPMMALRVPAAHRYVPGEQRDRCP
jgi:hypothetical protein